MPDFYVPRHFSFPLPETGDYQHISVEPMTLALGAVISGVDLSGPVEAAAYDEIADALWRHHVVFFRGQELTPDGHMALAGHFGEMVEHEIFKADADNAVISVLENDADRPPEINAWHTDVTFRRNPTLLSVLYCEDAPPVGGDTIWMNQALAFDTLAPATQEMLLDLEAEHCVFYAYEGSDLLTRAGGKEKVIELAQGDPTNVHPMVIAHPITGRPTLFANWGFTKRIVGMRRAQSEALLAMLYEHQYLPEFQVRFKWAPGSIAIWDNFAVQHYAVADYYPMHRLVKRITVKGPETVAARSRTEKLGSPHAEQAGAAQAAE
jgi:taurine dioxygenase